MREAESEVAGRLLIAERSTLWSDACFLLPVCVCVLRVCPFVFSLDATISQPSVLQRGAQKRRGVWASNGRQTFIIIFVPGRAGADSKSGQKAQGWGRARETKRG